MKPDLCATWVNKVFWLIPVAVLAGAAVSVATYQLVYAGSDPADVVPGMMAWQLIGGAAFGALSGAIASTSSYFVLRAGKSVPVAAMAAFFAITGSWAAFLFASVPPGVGFPVPEAISAALSAAAAASFILVIGNRANRTATPKIR